MILGIGNDLCDVEHIASVIQRHGRRFLDRTFTQAEQALAQRRSEPCLFYAGRFAAKEAFVKALGTGIIEQVHWTDIGISRLSIGSTNRDNFGRSAHTIAAACGPRERHGGPRLDLERCSTCYCACYSRSTLSTRWALGPDSLRPQVTAAARAIALI